MSSLFHLVFILVLLVHYSSTESIFGQIDETNKENIETHRQIVVFDTETSTTNLVYTFPELPFVDSMLSFTDNTYYYFQNAYENNKTVLTTFSEKGVVREINLKNDILVLSKYCQGVGYYDEFSFVCFVYGENFDMARLYKYSYVSESDPELLDEFKLNGFEPTFFQFDGDRYYIFQKRYKKLITRYMNGSVEFWTWSNYVPYKIFNVDEKYYALFYEIDDNSYFIGEVDFEERKIVFCEAYFEMKFPIGHVYSLDSGNIYISYIGLFDRVIFSAYNVDTGKKAKDVKLSSPMLHMRTLKEFS